VAHSEKASEPRPSVAAYFAELEEQAIPFLAGLGQVVVAAAALESNLRLELACCIAAAETGQESTGGKALGEQVAKIETLTAGQLLRRLSEKGLPEELERRIDDVISRRNRLIHHLFEDPRLVNSVVQTEAADDAVEQLQRLALDCAALSVELQMFALPKIESLTGVSKEQLLDSVLSLDAAQIPQQAKREQLEAIQALGDIGDWTRQSKLTFPPPDELWGINAHHRVTVEWLGERFETLADLLRPGLRAVCVGINPSPVSVAAGHYYQGRIGRRFWQRLHQVGLIEAAGTGREDDVAFLTGIGFTDIVKRPTPRADGIAAAEFEHGRDLLIKKLRRYRPPLLIFTFKRTATTLFGRFNGHGYRPELEFAGARVFVMPGPYERADRVAAALQQLRELLGERAQPANPNARQG
jgi:double-stranded uracil-DNA glycosylase